MLLNLTARILPGHAYGFIQPTLLIKLDWRPSASLDTAAFDALMADLLDDPASAGSLAASGPQAALDRLMDLHLRLQRGQKIPVFGVGRVLSVAPMDGSSDVRATLAVPYCHVQASNIAMDWAKQAVNALLCSAPQPQAVEQVRDRMQACEKRLRPFAAANTNTMHFLKTAFDQGITTWRLWSTAYGFGTGSRMRWLDSSLTDEGSSIAVSLARNKLMTADMLRRHGIPTPRHEPVRTVEEALAVAGKIGYPVVVKPVDQDQGRGVSAGLKDEASVRQAFEQASAVSRHILLEKHHDGRDYRLTVFRGEIIKVMERRPGAVVGNGVRTVRELVEIEQQTPQHRRIFRQSGKRRIDLDAEALGLLHERGWNADSVPPAGETVVLRRKSNISTGGTQLLVPPERIHPDNVSLVARACEAIRLDLCGVDLLIPDISQSWLATGAVIIELNAIPQIGISLDPEAYARILDRLGGGQWAIPTQLVLCGPDVSIPSPAELTAMCGPADGIASPQGVWISGRPILNQPGNGFEAAQTLMYQRSVQRAICCMTIDEVARLGLPVPRFDRIMLVPGHSPSPHDTAQLNRVRAMLEGHASRIVVGRPGPTAADAALRT